MNIGVVLQNIKNVMNRITFIFLLFTGIAFSQVGINTENPDASSILEIYSTDKGVLIPRVELTGNQDTATISSPAIGLLVYVTGSHMTNGFYYWDGTEWVSIKGESNINWSLEGNVVSGDEFIGTTNNSSFILKVANSTVGNFHPDGGLTLGINAVANTNKGIAIGHSSYSESPNNVSLGTGSSSTGANAFAMGTYAQSSGEYGTAVGTEAKANGYNATAFGHLAESIGSESLAIGGGAKAGESAGDISAVAVGPYAKATKEKSFALGPNTEATAINSFALGIGAVADKENTIILGEVRNGEIDETPLLVGIGTKDPKARLDVDGRFKLGQRGSVMRNLSGFSHTFGNGDQISANGYFVFEITIPQEQRPFTLKATINTTIVDTDGDFDDIRISWAKFQSDSVIRVKIVNDDDENPVNLENVVINISLVEFD